MPEYFSSKKQQKRHQKVAMMAREQDIALSRCLLKNKKIIHYLDQTQSHPDKRLVSKHFRLLLQDTIYKSRRKIF